MKILCIANERTGRKGVTDALGELGPAVSIAWASRLDEAAQWLERNRDVDALVVELETDSLAGIAVLKHLRRLGLAAPAVAITPDEADIQLAALKAGADDYLAKTDTLFDNLPRVVRSAIDRAHQHAERAAKQPLRLLYVGDVALARTCLEQLGSRIDIDVTETGTPQDGTLQTFRDTLQIGAALPFDIVLVEHGHPGVDVFAILKDIAARGLHVPVILVVESDEELAMPALKMGAMDYVVKAREPLTALLFRLGRDHHHVQRTRSSESSHPLAADEGQSSESDLRLERERHSRKAVEQKLEAAEASLRGAEQRRASDVATFTVKLAEERAKFDTSLADVTASRHALAKKLSEAEAALESVVQLRSLEAANHAELVQANSELRSRLAHAIRAGDALRQQLTDTQVIAETARENHSAAAEAVDRLTSREAELHALLSEVTKTCNTLDLRLIDAETARKEANERAVRDRLAAAERKADLEKRLEHEAQTRQTLEKKLNNAEIARRITDQRHALAIKAATTQLNETRANYESRLTRAVTAWEMVNEQLKEAAAAINQARQQHASAAATVEQLKRREAELTSVLGATTEARDKLAVRLADTDVAQRETHERALREQLAAKQRESELEARLKAEVEKVRILETRLAQGETARKEIEERHATTMTAAAAQFAGRQAQLEADLKRATAGREAAEQQLHDANVALKDAEGNHASAIETVAQLTHREAELGKRLSEAAAIRDGVGRRLKETEAALKEAADRASREQLAAGERQAQLESQLARKSGSLATLEAKLAESEKAQKAIEERHSAAMTTSTARSAERHALLEAEFRKAVVAGDTLKKKLSEAQAAAQAARQDSAAAIAAVEQLSRRESELQASLAQATAARNALERRLADADAAHKEAAARASREQLAAKQQQASLEARLAQEAATRQSLEAKLAEGEKSWRAAEQQHARAMTGAAAQFADRHTKLETELKQVLAAREALKQQLNETKAAADAARQGYASASDTVERLSRKEAELEKLLTDAATTRQSLEQRLVEAESARKEGADRATRELLAAKQRYAGLEARFGQEIEACQSLEKRLADAETERQSAEERHATAMARGASQFAARHAQIEAELRHAVAARETLHQRLNETTATLDEARRNQSAVNAVVDQLKHREAELTARLTETVTSREALARQLNFSEAALKAAAERVTREQLVAKERHEKLERLIAEGADRRKALETEIVEVRACSAEEQQTLRAEISALSESAREQASRLERFTDERIHHHNKLTELRGQIREIEQERESLRESLEASHEQLTRLKNEHRERVENLERARLTVEAEALEHAARHAASMQAAERSFAQVQDEFRATLAARSRDIDQLQLTLQTTVQQLERTKSHGESLQMQANRVPVLQDQLEENHAEFGRRFDQHPLAMCRCTREGVLTHANRAFAALMGCQADDGSKVIDAARAAFESSFDLSTLIEQCPTPGRVASIESRWKRTDGSRLDVRLSAVATSDAVDIVVEDLTSLRALQDRLAKAQRMEAVGRLASEIAVTCGNLLRDVSQNGQRWLATLDTEPAQQHQGRLLLGEVTRAANFLQQLSAYGNEQADPVDPVDLTRVLSDLEPVLKRVAGERIELVLPKKPSRGASLNVDVKSERVERLLVNLASYGRERMPHGGQLKIDLATVDVDQKFVAKYPNVRRGPHVLITVTEVRDTMRVGGPLGRRETTAEANDSAPEKPGVDLGALQGLIRESGGHLWMEVEPPGNMVAKIHLPLRASADATRGNASRSGRARSISRLFHH